jgi:ADP-ribosylglycohydrolase
VTTTDLATGTAPRSPKAGPLPSDYAERVYAGVLGKLIGVYLGRPIEGWSYERISNEIGEVDHYLTATNGAPLVVTDDDVTGTFTFLRALEDEGYPANLTPEQIGNNWLNYTIERRTIFWWGGVGNSTEHTAYERLKSGIPAPESGSRARNGKVISEQIGAQIFIDGWAMVAPGDPEFAADLARRAASVSHDGEAIYGAQVIAAMEAQAFVESDINTLIDTGLSVIPRDSTIARLIYDIREWHAQESDWRAARERIAANYGYDKYRGACHMVPNHGLIIHALLYGEGDFRRSQMIVNTSGWDTDCNAANVGCLLGIRGGLATFDGDYDWRGPVADRMYLSTADGSRAITDALTESYRIVKAASALRGESFAEPKDGAKFHFTLPGSVQGFERDRDSAPATVANPSGGALRIEPTSGGPVRVMTPTFIPEEALAMPGYQLFASPTIYPGQSLSAVVRNDGNEMSQVRMVLRQYGVCDRSEVVSGESVRLAAGTEQRLTWRVPDNGGLPIHAVGLECEGAAPVVLDSLTWSGAPTVTFARPDDRSATLWRRAWVDAVDHFEGRYFEAFRISQNEGRGVMAQGTRDWTDYSVRTEITPYLAKNVGIAIRVQGLKRYYALLLSSDQVARLIKMDDTETILAEVPFAWDVFTPYTVSLQAEGDQLIGRINDAVSLTASDPASRLTAGGAGFVIEEGTMGSESISVSAS